MLPEAIVLFACINGTGCSSTSSLYFSQNPEVKAMLDRDAEKVTKIVGPTTIEVVGPFLFFAAGGRGVVKLSNDFSVQAEKTGGRLVFRIDF
jgi:hypothetical protein